MTGTSYDPPTKLSQTIRKVEFEDSEPYWAVIKNGRFVYAGTTRRAAFVLARVLYNDIEDDREDPQLGI